MPTTTISIENDEKRQQADALAESYMKAAKDERRRLNQIMDLLPCYVALMNSQNQFVLYNKAFVDFFGEPQERPCYEALRAQKKKCAYCPPMATLQGEGQTVMDWVPTHKKYAFRTYSYSFSEPDGQTLVLKVGFDVTSTMRVQQALELSEQSYRAITDNLSIGVALLDTSLRIRAGNIRLSQWFAEGFHLDRSICDLLDCPKWPLKTDKSQACSACALHGSLQDGLSHEMELAVNFRDRPDRMVRLVACPVKSTKRGSRKGEVRAVIMMLEDITTRLRVNCQLQRAHKIEAVSTLAGGIAHEINQPLSALHLYASGLQLLFEKEQPPSLETIEERLSLVMREADKIRSIINHMRTLVMRDCKKTYPVSLEKSIHSILAQMKTQWESHRLDVTVDIAPNLPQIRGNELQLEQVLVNLLTNALHALDEVVHPETLDGFGDSCADVAASRGKMRRISLRAFYMDEEQLVRLEVADSGPGLPKDGERIFDPFYTTKEGHKGMGLGLTIAHGLVSLWGGEISALAHHSELGGAVFFVDLLPYTMNDTDDGRIQDDMLASGEEDRLFPLRGACVTPASEQEASGTDKPDVT